ncbi:hypothetical protein RSAG8_13095, partial [Rhizoctonia solani AG-8 WAC10335]
MSLNNPPETLPLPVSHPRTHRRCPRCIRSINDLSDADVWSHSDKDICDAALTAWKADIYKKHYTLTLVCHTKPIVRADGTIYNAPDYMEYRFGCKDGVDAATINLRFQEEEEESEDEWIPNNRPLWQSADVNSIETYLRTEPVSRKVVRLAGGPLKYWDTQKSLMSCSDLARFAIDYLSAPASSVEVEHAFSCGRLMTNHLQHQMPSETFQAKMALRLWYKTPLLQDMSELATVLGGHIRGINPNEYF